MLKEIYGKAKAGEIGTLKTAYRNEPVSIENIYDAVLFYKICRLGFVPYVYILRENNKFLSWKEIFFILRKCSNKMIAKVIWYRNNNRLYIPYKILRATKDPLSAYAYYIEYCMKNFIYQDLPGDINHKQYVLRNAQMHVSVMLSKGKLVFMDKHDKSFKFKLEDINVQHVVVNKLSFVYYDAMLYIVKNGLASVFSTAVKLGMRKQYLARRDFNLDILFAVLGKRRYILKLCLLLKK